MSPDTINVIIEAQGAETRQLVASLIQDKLQTAGFSNVDTGIASRDDTTSKVVGGEALPSLLDEIRTANPQLFARPVIILAMPYSENPVEATEAHMGTMKDTVHEALDAYRLSEALADTAVVEALNNLELVID